MVYWNNLQPIQLKKELLAVLNQFRMLAIQVISKLKAEVYWFHILQLT